MTTEVSNTPSIEQATSLAGRVQVKSIRLLSAHCEQLPHRMRDGQQHAKYVCSTQAKADAEKNAIGVACAILIEVKPEGEAQEPAPVSIEAKFLLEYTVDRLDDITEDQLRSFGHFNGLYNAWPYFREYIQSAMTRMGLPAISLPAYRFGSQLQTDVK